MMVMKRKKLGAALVSALGAGVALAVAGPAAAQAPQPQAAQPQPAPRVEKIEITGSHIKRVDTETAAPVQILTREDIESSGKPTITEVLRTLPLNYTGGLNDITGSNSFSSGASTVSLRGLGSTATLVLINGRRVAPYGLADPNFGQSAVVNLDSIPLDVIERVEILKDGASAIYGSEAVAGVINIILRKDYKGAQAGGNFSQNRQAEYRNWRLRGTAGFGDLARDRWNVFFNAEHFDRDRTTLDEVEGYLVRPELRDSGYATGRHFSSSYAGSYLNARFDPVTLGSAVYTSFRPAAQQPPCVPGAVRDAGGICRWDLVPRQDVWPTSERDSFFARGTVQITNNLTGFAELAYNKIDTQYIGNPQVYGDFGAWYDSSRQRLVNLPEVLPVGHANNPFTTPIGYRHRFVELGNTDRIVKSDATRAVAGLQGTWRTWDWEASLLHSRNETTVVNKNHVRASVLRRGILQNQYNFFNPESGAIKPADLRVDTKDTAESSFTIADLRGSSEIWRTRNGPIALAAGVEYRKEEREANPDPLKVVGEIVGFGASFAKGDRHVTSVYGELSLPVLRNLEVQVAARSDEYSDYGNSATPKVAAKWKAHRTLLVRGSYAEGFRAPSLTENSSASVSAFTTVNDPKRCITGTEADCARGVAALIEANPGVQPETSKNYTLGLVWEPLNNLSIAVDAFDIRRTHEISILSITDIIDNEDNPSALYRGRVVRGVPGDDGLPGRIQAVRTFFHNGGKTEVKGFDVDAVLRVPLGEWGRLRNRLSTTYFDSWKGSGTDDEPLIEFVSYRVPRFKGSFTTEWEWRAWSVGLTANHVKNYFVSSTPERTCRQASLLGAGTATVPGVCSVPPQTTFDLAVRWRGIRNLTLFVVGRNIFDKQPPLDPLARPANFTFHEYRGLHYTVGFDYKFW